MSPFVSPRPFKPSCRAKAQRNHNPRVGGSSPSSGMVPWPFAAARASWLTVVSTSVSTSRPSGAGCEELRARVRGGRSRAGRARACGERAAVARRRADRGGGHHNVVLRIPGDHGRWAQRLGVGGRGGVHRRRWMRADGPVAEERLVIQRQCCRGHRRVHRAGRDRVPARPTRSRAAPICGVRRERPWQRSPLPLQRRLRSRSSRARCRARRAAEATATRSN